MLCKSVSEWEQGGFRPSPKPEVTEVVRKLLGGKAPGVDEIRPEYLKSLDVVGLSWLTCLCSIAWRSGTVPLEWQTGVVVPLFKKGDRQSVFQLQEDHTSQPPWESIHQGTGEENSGGTTRFSSRLVGGTLDQLYTLCRVLEGLWKFAQPVHMCFVDLEKAFDRVPRGILWGCSVSMGIRGPLLRAVWSLYDLEQELGSHCRAVRPVPSACWTPAGLPFVTGPVHNLYGQDYLGVARGWRESGLGTTGFHLCFFRR
ncbi:hypothetical protein L3Q82_020527 [Scortum barcoo]|uniref:Uncharacterized protein n=1 Tax=Scortum barcoo TaxID=214431 RepID=A0ACB8V7U8_9TELE|nr:hypothetical protein L3Q82_020527 [Scortum barcoo]